MTPDARWARLRAAVASLALGAGAPAWAQDSPPPDDAPADAPPTDPEPTDDPLSPYRTPFPVLVEQTLGTTSRPVEFSWRRSRGMVAAQVLQPVELNTFDSLRLGALGRFPAGELLLEAGASWVFTWDTEGSRQLALTPYRQAGRPSRLHLEVNLGLPLAEGIVTTRPRWLPALQMALMGWVGLHYHSYPGAMRGMGLGDRAAATLSPALTQPELTNLDARRLDAMRVDTGRYELRLGLSPDLYLRQGVFVSPRLTVALPLLAPASGTTLLWSGEAGVAVGVAL